MTQILRCGEEGGREERRRRRRKCVLLQDTKKRKCVITTLNKHIFISIIVCYAYLFIQETTQKSKFKREFPQVAWNLRMMMLV